jgi:hypothetical protein
MLRHHEWITAVEPDRCIDATTVAIMLTPRHDRVRPWDTTLFAFFGELTFEADELTSMQRLWNNPENVAPETEPESGGDPIQDDGSRG